MADPTKFTPSFDYSAYEASSPTSPKPGADLDNDFANVATSVNGAIDALKSVRRSDGALNNGLVTPDSLNPTVLRILAGGGAPRGAWTVGTAYVLKDIVSYTNGSTYMCVTAHTAGGDFTADLAAGKWILFTAAAPVFATIAALRANILLLSGQGYVQGGLAAGDGGEGFFRIDASDHATADNGGTVIVDGVGQRWKRALTGAFYSALWFCPHRDGVTDDLAILQAAVDAAKTAGRTLYIPAGVYALSGTLNLNSATGGHGIFGDVPQWSDVNGLVGGTILKSTNTAGAHALSVSGGGNGQNLLRNFAVLGSGTNGNGIDCANIYSTFFEKLYVTGHGGHGIYLPQCFGMHVTDCNIGNNKRSGVYLAGQANGTVIRGNLFFNNDNAGGGYADVIVDGTVGNSLGVSIVDNIFEGGALSEFAISASNTNGLLIQGNYLEIYQTHLVYLAPTVQGFDVNSNYFQDGQVTVDGATQGKIAANVFLKEGSGATKLRVLSPAAGNNQVWVDPSNVFLGGATSDTPAQFGYPVLAAGVVRVNNTNANDALVPLLSYVAIDGTPGQLYIGAISNGAYFDIHSTSAADTSQVMWRFP